jgi:hypothetical protein
MGFSIIRAPKKTNWSISAEEVVEAMKKRWPDAAIKPIDDHPFRMDFTVMIDGLSVLGSLRDIGPSLPVWCPFGPELAQFALWFRTLVPPEQPLILTDDGYNYVIPLTPHTTIDDIVTMRTVIEPWGEGEDPPDQAFR